MKSKYVVLSENSHDATIYSEVKSFKNEPEALAFYRNPKNQRMYGTLFLERHSKDGVSEWNDREERWV